MTEKTRTETAVLAGGCFWCLEAAYQRIRGVERVEPGYTGGVSRNPTYEQVRSGTTGHAEAVRITFDPSVIPFADILSIFWRIHDPTTLNRQGADAGTQYRSAIFTVGPAQAAAAAASAKEAAKLFDRPIVTEIVPLAEFFPAEAHHRDYYRANPNQPYCRFVIDPKIRKLERDFRDKLKK